MAPRTINCGTTRQEGTGSQLLGCDIALWRIPVNQRNEPFTGRIVVMIIKRYLVIRVIKDGIVMLVQLLSFIDRNWFPKRKKYLQIFLILFYEEKTFFTSLHFLILKERKRKVSHDFLGPDFFHWQNIDTICRYESLNFIGPIFLKQTNDDSWPGRNKLFVLYTSESAGKTKLLPDCDLVNEVTSFGLVKGAHNLGNISLRLHPSVKKKTEKHNKNHEKLIEIETRASKTGPASNLER